MTPEQAPDGVREAVEKEVKHINQKVRSKAARVNNALRNAELEVLKGQRGGKRYRKPQFKTYLSGIITRRTTGKKNRCIAITVGQRR
mgnify:CR=1 FL=1